MPQSANSLYFVVAPFTAAVSHHLSDHGRLRAAAEVVTGCGGLSGVVECGRARGSGMSHSWPRSTLMTASAAPPRGRSPRRHSAGRRHRRDSFRVRRSTHDDVTKQCAPAPPAADPPAVMISTTTVAWAAAGAATTGLSARAAFRLSVSRDRPPVAGCPRCGRSFRAGIGGWLPGLRRCAGCHQINGPPWWALAVPGALVCGLLAARLPPSDAAGWALLVAWQLLAQAGIVLSVIDIAVHRLPTRTVTGTGVAITAAIATASGLQHSSQTLTRAGLGAVTVASVYLLLFILVPDGVGAGDVRLAAVTGLTLGSSSWRTVLWGIVLPYLLCFPFAVASAIRRHGDAHDAVHLPFGPFLIAGAVLSGIASR